MTPSDSASVLFHSKVRVRPCAFSDGSNRGQFSLKYSLFLLVFQIKIREKRSFFLFSENTFAYDLFMFYPFGHLYNTSYHYKLQPLLANLFNYTVYCIQDTMYCILYT